MIVKMPSATTPAPISNEGKLLIILGAPHRHASRATIVGTNQRKEDGI